MKRNLALGLIVLSPFLLILGCAKTTPNGADENPPGSGAAANAGPASAVGGESGREANDGSGGKSAGEASSSSESPSAAELIRKIQDMNEVIKTAWENQTPEDAHDALHDIGHTLEALAARLGQRKSLTSSELEDATEEIEVLFDAFGKLDGMMHGGDEVTYSEVEVQVEASIGKLKEAIQ